MSFLIIRTLSYNFNLHIIFRLSRIRSLCSYEAPSAHVIVSGDNVKSYHGKKLQPGSQYCGQTLLDIGKTDL